MKGFLIISMVIISTIGAVPNPTATPVGPAPAGPAPAPVEAPQNHTTPEAPAPHNNTMPVPAPVPAHIIPVPAPVTPTPVDHATVLVLHTHAHPQILKAEYHHLHTVTNTVVLSGPLGRDAISPPYSFPMIAGYDAHVYLMNGITRSNEQTITTGGKYLLWADRLLDIPADTDKKFWAAWSSTEADKLVLTNADKAETVMKNGGFLDAGDYKQIEWFQGTKSLHKADITQNFAEKTQWIFEYVKVDDAGNSTMTQVPWLPRTTSTLTVLHGVTIAAPATVTFDVLHLDGTTTQSMVTLNYAEAKKLSFLQGDIFSGLVVKVNETVIAENRYFNLNKMDAQLPTDDYLVGDNVTLAALGVKEDGTMLVQFIRQNRDEVLATTSKMSIYRFANTLADPLTIELDVTTDSIPIPSQPETQPVAAPKPMEQPKPVPMVPEAPKETPKPMAEPKPAEPMEPKPVAMPMEPKPVAMPTEPNMPMEPKPVAPKPMSTMFSKFFSQSIIVQKFHLAQGDTNMYEFDATAYTSVQATTKIGDAPELTKDLLADAKATPMGEAQIIFFIGDSTQKAGQYSPQLIKVSEAPEPAPAPAPVASGESGFWSQPWPYIVIAAFVLVVFGGGFYFYKKQKEQTGSEGKPLLV